MGLDHTSLINRLMEMASEYGALQDRSEFEKADQTLPAFWMLRSEIYALNIETSEPFLSLLDESRTHWVRYFAAIVVMPARPDLAEPVLKQLDLVQGLVSLSAKLALSQINKVRH